MAFYPVNDRSLISDNNISQLTLGTGEVLSRYDYISTSYGLNKGTVGGLALSDGGIYWFDSKRAEMVVYSSNTGSVSKSQGVQGYMNNMKTSAASKVPIGFDYKYNEVLITVRGPYSPPVVVDPPVTNSYPYLTTEVPEIITNNTNGGNSSTMNTLIYSEQTGSFQSFTDIHPSIYIPIDGELFYLAEDGKIYKDHHQTQLTTRKP